MLAAPAIDTSKYLESYNSKVGIAYSRTIFLSFPGVTQAVKKYTGIPVLCQRVGGKRTIFAVNFRYENYSTI